MEKQNVQFYFVVLSCGARFCSLCPCHSVYNELRTVGATRTWGHGGWILRGGGVLPNFLTASPSQQKCKCLLGSLAVVQTRNAKGPPTESCWEGMRAGSGPGTGRIAAHAGGAVLPHPPSRFGTRQRVPRTQECRPQPPAGGQSWDWNPLQWWGMDLGVLKLWVLSRETCFRCQLGRSG